MYLGNHKGFLVQNYIPGKPYGLPGPELAGECGPCCDCWWKPFGSKLTFCGIEGSGDCWKGGKDDWPGPDGYSLYLGTNTGGSTEK